MFRDFKRGHFISTYLVSTILMIGMIATGQLILAAMAGLLGGFLVKLMRRTEQNSQQQLINVFAGHPNQVWLERDGVEIQIGFDGLQIGDVVIVHAGEVIPVDGKIKVGSASIDQHVLTGESEPVDKGIGEDVFASTLVLAGKINIQVETAGEETVAANIGRVLNNTSDYKDTLMLRGRKIADSLLPIELGLGAVTLVALGPIPAMGVLWSGLGYRMIMNGPISVLNYLQILARKGILIKDGRVLESLSKVDTVVFDKTGTLTQEQPTITAVHLFADYDESQILYYAASAEHRQTHPVAKAIIEKAQTQNITLSAPENTSYEVGYGIKVEVEQKTICVGSARFMQREQLNMPEQLDDLQQQAETFGYSLIYVGVDNEVAGVLEMQPTIRPEAHSLIDTLHQRGISTYIISGDHEQPTRNTAEQLGIDHYFAETLPENKADLIKQLRDEGRFVCFIGDGINDAIALKSAQISISLKGASSAATDTAQVIFMDGSLVPFERLFSLSDEFEGTMRNNFLISLVPGVINIGGIYLLHFGIAASMGLFYAGTTAGLVNSVVPLVKHQAEDTDS
ncbi:MAG: heavy metal translocating P-type ATPase, partial [Thiotrichaceae bacterium]|nr:heavy metal translocating P-type ATPase [Thiotrichaceae bacterium]